MVSELVDFKGHLPIHAPSPKSVGREGGVLGKTQGLHISEGSSLLVLGFGNGL